MTNKEIIEEVKEYLESWDIKPTLENIKNVLNEWIKNLSSQIGEEAHKYLLDCGIIDNTKMTWKEQDSCTIQQINAYKKCLATL